MALIEYKCICHKNYCIFVYMYTYNVSYRENPGKCYFDKLESSILVILLTETGQHNCKRQMCLIKNWVFFLTNFIGTASSNILLLN